MILYIRSTYCGSTNYTKYEGYDESSVRTLMAEIGHTNIEFIDKTIYETECPTLII